MHRGEESLVWHGMACMAMLAQSISGRQALLLRSRGRVSGCIRADEVKLSDEAVRFCMDCAGSI